MSETFGRYRYWVGVAAIAVVFAAVLLIRTARFTSPKLPAGPKDQTSADSGRIAAHLAEAIRYRTVSYQDPTQTDEREFAGFRAFLAKTYPLVSTRLTRERIGDRSTLYAWPGREPALPPILLMAHMDVVPVEPGTEALWKYPPFEGRIAGGEVWGRGALDDKLSLVALMEALEDLLTDGYAPRRSVFIEVGEDEEVGGVRGAASAANLLESRGVRFRFVLDEGGLVLRGMIPGVRRPVAMVGVAEKGYLALELSATSEGGHSSIPPRHTSAGLVSAAVVRLENNQMPGAIRRPVDEMLDRVGPEMPFSRRFALANRRLFGPLLAAAFGREPSTNAMVRTTTAVTMLAAGPKENVLPARASAVVNFRILPGDTVESVIEHVRRVVADPRIRITTRLGWNPSRVSNLGSESGRLVERSIRQIYPEALVSPALMAGASDSRRFANLSGDVYGFVPLSAGPEVVKLGHGTGERVSVEDCGRAMRFYRRLIRNATE